VPNTAKTSFNKNGSDSTGSYDEASGRTTPEADDEAEEDGDESEVEAPSLWILDGRPNDCAHYGGANETRVEKCGYTCVIGRV
jgi:hypothetical protein